MGILLDYEKAKTEKERAVAALACSRIKPDRASAWYWAETAARHAMVCGVPDARKLLGDGRWPDYELLQAALEETPDGITTDIEGVLELAAMLPAGLNDARAADKLLVQRDELLEALSAGSRAEVLTEAADAVYYVAKYLDWIARQVKLDIDELFRLAVAKYVLRARSDYLKNKQAEETVCLAVDRNC